MAYIDGCVLAVPTAKKAEYLEHAKMAAKVFKEYGVLAIVECWGDDVPDGEVTSFPMAVKASADETVVLSWMTWPSKATRDAAMPKLMQDERLSVPMPFDGKRMIFAGFEKVFEA